MSDRKWNGTALAIAALIAAMVAAAVWLLIAGRDLSFHGDELFYYADLVEKKGLLESLGGLEYLLAPHNGHLVLGGRAVYELIFALGGSDYFAFRLAETLGLLVCAGLLFVLVRRRTSVWLALAFALSALFFGTANEPLLWPFDLHTTYALALGLGAVLVLEGEGRWRDPVACLLLVLAVAFIELGLAFCVGIGVGILLAPDRWRRLWIVVVPVLVYGVWWLWAQRFEPRSDFVFSNLRLVAKDFVDAPAAVLGGLFGILPTGAGAPPELAGVTAAGTVLLGFAVLALALRLRRGPVAPTLWVFLATAFAYWLTIALGGRAPDSTRYMYVGAVLMLLVAAEALRGVRVPPLAIFVVYAALALALPANVAKLYDGRNQVRFTTQVSGAEFAMLDLAGDRASPDYLAITDQAVIDAGGGLFVSLNAGQYAHGRAENGSIGTPLPELQSSDLRLRTIADATLVGALAIAPEPVSTPAGAGDCPTVSGPKSAGTAYFELEPDGALLSPASGQPVELGVARFAGQGPGVAVGTVEPGEWVRLAPPGDRAPDPWLAVIDGPVQVCPAG